MKNQFLIKYRCGCISDSKPRIDRLIEYQQTQGKDFSQEILKVRFAQLFCEKCRKPNRVDLSYSIDLDNYISPYLHWPNTKAIHDYKTCIIDPGSILQRSKRLFFHDPPKNNNDIIYKDRASINNVTYDEHGFINSVEINDVYHTFINCIEIYNTIFHVGETLEEIEETDILHRDNWIFNFNFIKEKIKIV